MNADILRALDEGACVVTATQRLGFEVKAAYNAHQLTQNKTVWPTPHVAHWEGWMQALWQGFSAHSAQICLNNTQLQQVLADIIRADIQQQPEDNTAALAALWNVPATAKTALDAWQLCHQWQISYTKLQNAKQIDHASFGRWATKLYARLNQENWISAAQIPDKLMQANFPLARHTVLFGFDHFNVQQQAFIKHHHAAAASISVFKSKPQPATNTHRYIYADAREEWQNIGAWARRKLSENPQFKLGIITPNSESIRNLASQCLREQLTPAYFEQDTPEPFHFSQGQTLANVAIIKSALACLDLLGPIEFEQLTPIFLSKYWGSSAEQALRAFAVTQLHHHIAYRFDLFQLNLALKQQNTEQAENEIWAKLLAKLNQLQSTKAEHRGQHTIASWRSVFGQCLKTLGWAQASLDSTEFQAQQAWDKCLDNWLKLDTVSPAMHLNQALQSLKQHCQQTQFQAQADINAPIQIMGVLEAAELDFDATWLAGFDDQAWPAIRNANPFISIQLQISSGIAEADIRLQAKRSKLKTQQLLTLCAETHVSHAQTHGDIERDISPLLADIDVMRTKATPFSLISAIRAATPALKTEQDNIGKALLAGEARGGTGVIEQQSKCPFQAYATNRLKTRTQIAPEMGLNNIARGSLLHEVLQQIWHELKTSAALHTHLTNHTLDAFIERHTRRSVNGFAKLSGLGEAYVESECTRLCSLIQEWLKLESERPPFEIEATELGVAYDVNGLKLSFKLDRVDRLNSDTDPERLIMDYKSGTCYSKHWTSERLEQPQIPLYYLALEAEADAAIIPIPVTALAYAQVKQGECQFIGIAQHESLTDGITELEQMDGRNALKKEIEDWPQLKIIWQARISRLADEYLRGDAHVDPKNTASCQYCEFTPLCRINTQARPVVDNATD